jgi:LysR family hydrogen peroxide-inducible transcriptional activator
MSGLDWAHVEDDELLAAAPANHPMAASVRVDPDSLRGDDLILLEDGHCLRDHALAACGLEPPKGGATTRASRPPPCRPWCR